MFDVLLSRNEVDFGAFYPLTIWKFCVVVYKTESVRKLIKLCLVYFVTYYLKGD